MANNGIYDSNGVQYGGTSFNTLGHGDTVKDSQGNVGVVTAISPGTPGHPAEVEVECIAYPQAGLPNVSQGVNPSRDVVYANQLIILSHADGTGLVVNGPVTTLVGTNPPTDKNFMQV